MIQRIIFLLTWAAMLVTTIYPFSDVYGKPITFIITAICFAALILMVNDVAKMSSKLFIWSVWFVGTAALIINCIIRL